MESERSKLIDIFENYFFKNIEESDTMYLFKEHDLIIRIASCGIGMVNAASGTANMIRDYKPDIILNTGCAGAHSEDLKIGDVVLGTKYIPTTSVVINSKGDTHYYGLRLDENGETQSYFTANDVLFSIASDKEFLGDYAIHTGPISSSDMWIDNVERIKWMHDFFETLCEDMEASAIAQVSQFHNIPFLAIKDISNSVFAEKNIFDPYDHKVPHIAGENSARLVFAICKKLSNIISK